MYLYFSMKTLFIEARSDVDILPVIRKALPRESKIGLITTVQHIGELSKAKKFLESKGKKVFIGKGTTYPGQVLGCNVKAAKIIESKIDCFLYIGSGEFHPLGLETDKKIIIANPFSKQIREIDNKKYLAKKAARMAKAKDCKNFGIIVSTKLGQNNMQIAEKLKKKLNGFIFLTDNIRAEDLMNFPQIDCWVNTACPRIVDDQESFNRLIVNYDEV